MFTLGKILTLHHYHLPRNTTRRKFDRDDSELEELTDSHLIQSEEEWWWQYLTLMYYPQHKTNSGKCWKDKHIYDQVHLDYSRQCLMDVHPFDMTRLQDR
jgi:hypothetical protein